MLKDQHILVVDDDITLRTIIAAIFENVCNVLVASSGNEAISILEKSKIDLIFSDVVMPDGDGIELLDWVQKRDGIKIPVVLVTGQASISKENALERGAYDMIAKPFRKKVLTDIAEKILTCKTQG